MFHLSFKIVVSSIKRLLRHQRHSLHIHSSNSNHMQLSLDLKTEFVHSISNIFIAFYDEPWFTKKRKNQQKTTPKTKPKKPPSNYAEDKIN